jgi:hypothetical protein
VQRALPRSHTRISIAFISVTPFADFVLALCGSSSPLFFTVPLPGTLRLSAAQLPHALYAPPHDLPLFAARCLSRYCNQTLCLGPWRAAGRMNGRLGVKNGW